MEVPIVFVRAWGFLSDLKTSLFLQHSGHFSFEKERKKGNSLKSQETTKDLQVEGSRSYLSLVTPLWRGTEAPRTLVLLCFGAIREARMIRDRSLLS